MPNLKFSPLSIKTLLLVLSASLITFFLSTTVTYLYERASLLGAAHAAAESSVTQNAAAISQSLWDFDVPTLDAIAAGMAQSGSVSSVDIIERGKRIVSAKRVGGVSTGIDRSWRVPIRSPDGTSDIGELEVAESYASVKQRALSEALLLAIGELFQIAGLSAILFVIVHRLITRHLSALAGNVRQLEIDGADQVVTLGRRSQRHDELDDLVDALNRFHRGQAEEHQRRTRAETVLQQRVAEIEMTLGALTAGVVTLDRGGMVVYANRAACELLRAPADTIRGRHYQALLSVLEEVGGGDRTHLIEDAFAGQEALIPRGSLSLRPSGAAAFSAELSILPTCAAGDVALILVFRDISAEIGRERQIEHQAFHDPLTGLGNRSLLAKKFPEDIARARSSGERIAVLYVDLDKFKTINDSLGHRAGDNLLRQLGTRLREFIAAPAWITRQGGDEFIIVMPSLTDEDSLIRFIERLMLLIHKPYQSGDVEMRVSCSIGVSYFPDHGDGIGELISRADMGMFAAKKYGRNTYSIFSEKLQQETRTRLAIEHALKSALLADEFALTYQPIVELGGGCITAAEVLLRWNSLQLGSVSPAVFIPIAEETGLIVDIGEWVLKQSAASALRWRAQLGYDIELAVNVSAVQFQSPKFLPTLEALKAESESLPRLLTLEITETALVGDVADLSERLAVIRSLGFRIAIDDFGTGYSSLSYLKNLPVDTLKIDREFIRELNSNPKNLAIVAAIIQLGKSLDFAIVAEGVEEAECVKILRDLKCDFAQGYHYAKPASEAQILVMIQALAAERRQAL